MSTGMPELPEGYFWRVLAIEGHVSSERVVVDIRRKRLFGSVSVAGQVLQSKTVPEGIYSAKGLAAPLTDENVLHTAQIVLKHWNRRKAKAATAKRLLGDYPPNKLELNQD